MTDRRRDGWTDKVVDICSPVGELKINFTLNLNMLKDYFCLFDLILYVHSTIFQLCGTVLPGFNQYSS